MGKIQKHQFQIFVVAVGSCSLAGWWTQQKGDLPGPFQPPSPAWPVPALGHDKIPRNNTGVEVMCVVKDYEMYWSPISYDGIKVAFPHEYSLNAMTQTPLL